MARYTDREAEAGLKTKLPALETFPNPKPGRPYEISMECPEFTCVCPVTGQPDFATIRIRFVPNRTCVELKSLKLYLWSFRDQGTFHEAVTNRICDDLGAVLRPRRLTVISDWKARGGFTSVITAEWQPKRKPRSAR